MSLANFTDFSVYYYNGTSWSDTYNSIDFHDISNLNNYPSFTSELKIPEEVGSANLSRVGGKNIEVDSGGFFPRFTFELVAKNANGRSVLHGLIDKTQNKNTTYPYFRIYPDVVNNPSDYYDVNYVSYQFLYSIQNVVRGGRFTFESRDKLTTWKQL